METTGTIELLVQINEDLIGGVQMLCVLIGVQLFAVAIGAAYLGLSFFRGHD